MKLEFTENADHPLLAAGESRERIAEFEKIYDEEVNKNLDTYGYFQPSAFLNAMSERADPTPAEWLFIGLNLGISGQKSGLVWDSPDRKTAMAKTFIAQLEKQNEAKNTPKFMQSVLDKAEEKLNEMRNKGAQA